MSEVVILPGSYSKDSRPPRCGSKIIDYGEEVEFEAENGGSPTEYVVRIAVRNPRDGRSAVQVYWISKSDTFA